MRAVVIASGGLEPGDEQWLARADLVVAADGGAGSLDRLGRRPDLLVGDLDSIDPGLAARLAADGVPVERHPADKDASDTELAIDRARDAGASEVVVIGAVGGTRLDHELANLLLLVDPALAGCAIRVVRGSTTVRAMRGGERLDLDGTRGDVVSLLPIGGAATGVTTEGLRWELSGATLEMGRTRGLSNEVVSRPASVRFERGALLVVETSSEGETP